MHCYSPARPGWLQLLLAAGSDTKPKDRDSVRTSLGSLSLSSVRSSLGMDEEEEWSSDDLDDDGDEAARGDSGGPPINLLDCYAAAYAFDGTGGCVASCVDGCGDSRVYRRLLCNTCMRYDGSPLQTAVQ